MYFLSVAMFFFNYGHFFDYGHQVDVFIKSKKIKNSKNYKTSFL